MEVKLTELQRTGFADCYLRDWVALRVKYSPNIGVIHNQATQLFASYDLLRAEVAALKQERDALKYRLQTWDDTNADRPRAEHRIPPDMTAQRLEKLTEFVDRYAFIQGIRGRNEVREMVLGWAKWLREHPAPSGEPTRTEGLAE